MRNQRLRELRIYRHRARRYGKWRKENGTFYRTKTKAEKRQTIRSMREVMLGLNLGRISSHLGLGHAS